MGDRKRVQQGDGDIFSPRRDKHVMPMLKHPGSKVPEEVDVGRMEDVDEDLHEVTMTRSIIRARYQSETIRISRRRV